MQDTTVKGHICYSRARERGEGDDCCYVYGPQEEEFLVPQEDGFQNDTVYLLPHV